MVQFDYEEYCKFVEKEREGASSDILWLMDYIDDIVHDFIIDPVPNLCKGMRADEVPDINVGKIRDEQT